MAIIGIIVLGILILLSWFIGNGTNSLTLAATVFFFPASLVEYFAPTIVAIWRKKPNATAIGVLNLLLGWTGIGWIVALIWAFANDDRGGEPPVSSKAADETSISPARFKNCPFCAEQIQGAAIRCKHCGSDLPLQSAPATRLTSQLSHRGGWDIPPTVTPGSPASSADKLLQSSTTIAEGAAEGWVNYTGSSPQLRLRIRAHSPELFELVKRRHLDEVGRHKVARLSPDEALQFENEVAAEAYVTDWEDAGYANGAKMFFSAASLGRMMTVDPLLRKFILDEAHRRSPAG